MVSDIDEIANAKILNLAYKICYWTGRVVYFRQSWFLFYLNARVVDCNQIHFAHRGHSKNLRSEKWLGTFACVAGSLNRRYEWGINRLWGMKWGDYHLAEAIIDDAGWHFSYIGGMSSIISKLNAWGVPLYPEQSEEDIKVGKFIGCSLSIESIGEAYPTEIKNHPKAWEHLMAHQSSFDELAAEYRSYKLNEINLSES